MLSLYNQFGHIKKDSKDIESNFKIIFPTEDFVAESHLGVEGASSVILQGQYWDDGPGFPKKSFCKLEGKSKFLNRNLFHAKFMIAIEKENEGEINDDTVLYFGSHNFSGGAWGNIEKNGS